jgi:hypothetical protein
MQAKGMPSQGTSSFRSENPPFGALFTYYLDDIPKTSKAGRQETEKSLRKENASIPFPGWESLFEESKENDPVAMLLVRDTNGAPVRWIKAPAKKGLNRLNWDLRFPAPDPINLNVPAFKPPWAGDAEGSLVAPGNYSVELFILFEGKMTAQGEAQKFEVKPIPGTSSGVDFNAVAAFKQKASEMRRQISVISRKLGESSESLRYMKVALDETPKAAPELFERLNKLEDLLAILRKQLFGDPIRQSLNESTTPSISSRVGQVIGGHWNTRQMPTATQKRNLEIAETDFEKFKGELKTYFEDLSSFDNDLESAGAPWTPGRKF